MLSNKRYSYLALILLITLGFTAMFIERYIPHFEKLSLIIFLIAGVISLFYRDNLKILLSRRITFLIILPLFGSFVYSILILSPDKFFLQLLIYVSSFLPLILIGNINKRQTVQIIRLILLFSLSQIFFDIFFPNPEYSDLDKYAGTFNTGNDKSRYLYLIFFSVFFLGKDVINIKPGYTIIRFFISIPILISAFIGFSNLGLLMFLSSISLALITRRIWVFLLIHIIGFAILSRFMYNSELVHTNIYLSGIYHRYFDFEHGIVALYNYGMELLQETYYLGVGLGNWVTRAGQLYGTEYVLNSPPTMQIRGVLFESSYSPPSLSAFFLMLVEMGIWGLWIVIGIVVLLRKKLGNSYYGFVSFIFVFYMINYYPMYFEFNYQFFLMTSTTLIILKNKSQ